MNIEEILQSLGLKKYSIKTSDTNTCQNFYLQKRISIFSSRRIIKL